MFETPWSTIKIRFLNWSSYYAMAVIELGHVVQTTERRTRAKRHSE
jgi:hypothetical protein